MNGGSATPASARLHRTRHEDALLEPVLSSGEAREMSPRCIATPLDHGPRGTCGECDLVGFCDDLLDVAIDLSEKGIGGIDLWLRFRDPAAVLALAASPAREARRWWFVVMAEAPDPLTTDWFDERARQIRELLALPTK